MSCFRFLLIMCLFFQHAHLTHHALVLTVRLAQEKQSSCTSLLPRRFARHGSKRRRRRELAQRSGRSRVGGNEMSYSVGKHSRESQREAKVSITRRSGSCGAGMFLVRFWRLCSDTVRFAPRSDGQACRCSPRCTQRVEPEPRFPVNFVPCRVGNSSWSHPAAQLVLERDGSSKCLPVSLWCR